MSDTKSLIDAWDAWDASPHDKRLSDRLEDSLQLAAKRYDIPSSQLRDDVNWLRRKGLSLETAVVSVMETCETLET